ncbi:MAG: preprotein translocase subunit YajC [Burkholderiaceae bacterium]|nr:MAG: preprotein translocase subunit YajC [Burkholderiaceae bacterium]
MVFISNAYAQAAAPAGGELFGSMLPLLLMFVVLYFLMIRPQMKKAKEHRAMLEGIQQGDEVVTASGLVGKIVKVGEAYITLEIAQAGGNAIEIAVQKGSVQTLLPKGTIKSI